EVSFQMERIHFDFDAYTLSAEARQILAATGSYLLANPGVNIVIEGHCDERGSDEYNLALGERRARATQNYLVSLGVAAERTRIISYGEERPLDPASNEAAWAKNRRAEFVR
ncbi:peptidoglycan-associated lipoprotein Pal, partial [Geoalkalibacter sp.]|uniref:peptidoglycan-associated lipoprotein Pal n=1 Tax=Geoalkalibacter sp. TaxID=3041440 RepID=UPI00272ECDD1